MERRTPDFARILAPATQDGDGDAGPLRDAEIDAVIELAFMMANANGDASPDEIESFRALVKHLQPGANVGALLEEHSEKLEGGGPIEERVRAAAAHLTRTSARELAYKAVYAVAVFDLETNEEEGDLEDLVIKVLGIEHERVKQLAREATQGLSK
ncbi:MAG: TerB family tellurite resistance protein [Labilithrix sp.]|nr:TerB family tellurite resistance protein [Labilithrix sp.]